LQVNFAAAEENLYFRKHYEKYLGIILGEYNDHELPKRTYDNC